MPPGFACFAAATQKGRQQHAGAALVAPCFLLSPHCAGVADYCYFMKEVSDTVELRKKIQEAFELAALPGTSEEDRRRVLHFVVVGGGPTGVEFAGTLNDFVRVDLAKKYPE